MRNERRAILRLRYIPLNERANSMWIGHRTSIGRLTWGQPKSTQCCEAVGTPCDWSRIWILTVDRERMFAKPFISQLGNGHVQGVYSMCKNPSSLSMMASGSGDGVVKVWSLTSRDETWRTSAQ